MAGRCFSHCSRTHGIPARTNDHPRPDTVAHARRILVSLSRVSGLVQGVALEVESVKHSKVIVGEKGHGLIVVGSPGVNGTDG